GAPAARLLGNDCRDVGMPLEPSGSRGIPCLWALARPSDSCSAAPSLTVSAASQRCRGVIGQRGQGVLGTVGDARNTRGCRGQGSAGNAWGCRSGSGEET